MFFSKLFSQLFLIITLILISNLKSIIIKKNNNATSFIRPPQKDIEDLYKVIQFEINNSNKSTMSLLLHENKLEICQSLVECDRGSLVSLYYFLFLNKQWK
jgi:hypothetical protein